MSALVIKNVTKRYNEVKSVVDVSLNIEPGERIALLGHNGAGKTTLIKMILGLVKPTSGSIEVLGVAPGSKKARLLTSYLPENVAFHGSLTGREQMRHFAALKSQNTKKADELLEKVGLSHAMNRKIATYSKGMRQRIGLAQALLGKPKLALLDEPTSGLDPISRHEFYDIVKDLSNNGTAVIISSHALTEVETKTDRIAILSQGNLVANESLEVLRKSASLPILIKIKASDKKINEVANSFENKKLNSNRVNGQTLELFCKQNQKIDILGQISAFGNAIKDIDITPPSLEELYRYYSTSKPKDSASLEEK